MASSSKDEVSANTTSTSSPHKNTTIRGAKPIELQRQLHLLRRDTDASLRQEQNVLARLTSVRTGTTKRRMIVDGVLEPQPRQDAWSAFRDAKRFPILLPPASSSPPRSPPRRRTVSTTAIQGDSLSFGTFPKSSSSSNSSGSGSNNENEEDSFDGEADHTDEKIPTETIGPPGLKIDRNLLKIIPLRKVPISNAQSQQKKQSTTTSHLHKTLHSDQQQQPLHDDSQELIGTLSFGDYSTMDSRAKRNRIRQGISVHESKIQLLLGQMKDRVSLSSKASGAAEAGKVDAAATASGIPGDQRVDAKYSLVLLSDDSKDNTAPLDEESRPGGRESIGSI